MIYGWRKFIDRDIENRNIRGNRVIKNIRFDQSKSVIEKDNSIDEIDKKYHKDLKELIIISAIRVGIKEHDIIFDF